MKALALIIVSTFTIFAGLEESKQWYDAQLTALNAKYVAKLKIERRNALKRGDAKEMVAIDKEIARLTATKVEPLTGTYKITYSTGVRHYEFGDKGLWFVEGRTQEPCTWTDTDTLVIKHGVGAVETWTKARGGFSVLFVTPEGRKIKGFAVPKK